MKAYRASEDVGHQVEEALRLGRKEPLNTQESVRLVEKILRRLQNSGELDADVRSRAERIVRRRESES